MISVTKNPNTELYSEETMSIIGITLPILLLQKIDKDRGDVTFEE
jgi:hypothetical protein